MNCCGPTTSSSTNSNLIIPQSSALHPNQTPVEAANMAMQYNNQVSSHGNNIAQTQFTDDFNSPDRVSNLSLGNDCFIESIKNSCMRSAQQVPNRSPPRPLVSTAAAAATTTTNTVAAPNEQQHIPVTSVPLQEQHPSGFHIPLTFFKPLQITPQIQTQTRQSLQSNLPIPTDEDCFSEDGVVLSYKNNTTAIRSQHPTNTHSTNIFNSTEQSIPNNFTRSSSNSNSWQQQQQQHLLQHQLNSSTMASSYSAGVAASQQSLYTVGTAAKQLNKSNDTLNQSEMQKSKHAIPNTLLAKKPTTFNIYKPQPSSTDQSIRVQNIVSNSNATTTATTSVAGHNAFNNRPSNYSSALMSPLDSSLVAAFASTATTTTNKQNKVSPPSDTLPATKPVIFISEQQEQQQLQQLNMKIPATSDEQQGNYNYNTSSKSRHNSRVHTEQNSYDHSIQQQQQQQLNHQDYYFNSNSNAKLAQRRRLNSATDTTQFADRHFQRIRDFNAASKAAKLTLLGITTSAVPSMQEDCTHSNNGSEIHDLYVDPLAPQEFYDRQPRDLMNAQQQQSHLYQLNSELNSECNLQSSQQSPVGHHLTVDLYSDPFIQSSRPQPMFSHSNSRLYSDLNLPPSSQSPVSTTTHKSHLKLNTCFFDPTILPHQQQSLQNLDKQQQQQQLQQQQQYQQEQQQHQLQQHNQYQQKEYEQLAQQSQLSSKNHTPSQSIPSPSPASAVLSEQDEQLKAEDLYVDPYTQSFQPHANRSTFSNASSSRVKMRMSASLAVDFEGMNEFQQPSNPSTQKEIKQQLHSSSAMHSERSNKAATPLQQKQLEHQSQQLLSQEQLQQSPSSLSNPNSLLVQYQSPNSSDNQNLQPSKPPTSSKSSHQKRPHHLQLSNLNSDPYLHSTNSPAVSSTSNFNQLQNAVQTSPDHPQLFESNQEIPPVNNSIDNHHSGQPSIKSSHRYSLPNQDGQLQVRQQQQHQLLQQQQQQEIINHNVTLQLNQTGNLSSSSPHYFTQANIITQCSNTSELHTSQNDIQPSSTKHRINNLDITITPSTNVTLKQQLKQQQQRQQTTTNPMSMPSERLPSSSSDRILHSATHLPTSTEKQQYQQQQQHPSSSTDFYNPIVQQKEENTKKHKKPLSSSSCSSKRKQHRSLGTIYIDMSSSFNGSSAGAPHSDHNPNDDSKDGRNFTATTQQQSNKDINTTTTHPFSLLQHINNNDGEIPKDIEGESNEGLKSASNDAAKFTFNDRCSQQMPIQIVPAQNNHANQSERVITNSADNNNNNINSTPLGNSAAHEEDSSSFSDLFPSGDFSVQQIKRSRPSRVPSLNLSQPFDQHEMIQIQYQQHGQQQQQYQEYQQPQQQIQEHQASWKQPPMHLITDPSEFQNNPLNRSANVISQLRVQYKQLDRKHSEQLGVEMSLSKQFNSQLREQLGLLENRVDYLKRSPSKSSAVAPSESKQKHVSKVQNEISSLKQQRARVNSVAKEEEAQSFESRAATITAHRSHMLTVKERRELTRLYQRKSSTEAFYMKLAEQQQSNQALEKQIQDLQQQETALLRQKAVVMSQNVQQQIIRRSSQGRV